MATQAKITSTEALETFRAALIVFLTKSKRALDDANDEIRRTRQWVQQDQRVHYEGEYKRRKRRLEQAQQELMSAKLATHRKGAVVQRELALAKAQRDVDEAADKLRRLQTWSANFDSMADPIVKRMERLRQSLNDLPKGIAYLVAVQKTLDSYAEMRAAPAPDLNGSAASGEPGGGLDNPLPNEIPLDLNPPDPNLPENAATEPLPSETPAPGSAEPVQP